MIDLNQIINGILGGAVTVIVAILTYVGVQRIVAKADAKDKEASARNRDAEATKRLQEVIAGMGDLYGDLVAHVRESVEAQIKAEYAGKIEALTVTVFELQAEVATERQAREADRQAWIEERREWEIGIGMLLAQMGEVQMKPRWKPKAMQTGPLNKPAEAHGFQSS